MTLGELAEAADGLDYTTAGAAVSRTARRLRADVRLQRQVRRLENQLSKFEM